MVCSTDFVAASVLSRWCPAICLAALLAGPVSVEGQQKPAPGGSLISPVSILRVQSEAEDPGNARYDWGPSVMRDGRLYKAWFVRLGGSNKKRFPYAATLPDGENFEFTYPDWGDRIFYAESRAGRSWHLDGADYAGPIEQFGPDATGPMMVLKPSESSLERNHVANPSVVKVADTYHLYYEACSDFILKRDAAGKIIVGNEYNNQVFVATSKDGRAWKKHPDDANPQPIIVAPASNKTGRQRYGLGQPSVFFRDGRFVMHYINSCTGPGDFMVRVEADNPLFRDAKIIRYRLLPPKGSPAVPAGSVSRFAQTDIKYLGKSILLVRPAYGTGNVNLMASQTGVFPADAAATSPAQVFPQLVLKDSRGDQYQERLFPRFLTDPEGQVLVEDGRIAIFYSSGLGFKDKAYTWDLFRCDVALDAVEKATGIRRRVVHGDSAR